MENYWSEFEYNKLKLLLNYRKVCSIIDVLNEKKDYDEIPPISVELHLTNKCNLKCAWCTDKDLRRESVSLELNTIEKLFMYFSRHSIGVTIEGGGEPTTHPNFQQIVELGSQMGIHMGLISNGVIDCSALAYKFRWIRISVDASSHGEYVREKGVDCFDRMLKNLEMISKARNNMETHLGVGYVITRGNIDGISLFLQRLNAMHVDYVYLRPVEEAPDAVPSLEQMLRLKAEIIEVSEGLRIKTLLNIGDRLIVDNDRLPCVAHSLTCIIQANGDVVMCEKRRQNPIVLGNVRETDFEEIWKCERRAIITRELLNPAMQAGCRECRITSFNRVFCDLNRIHTKNFI